MKRAKTWIILLALTAVLGTAAGLCYRYGYAEPFDQSYADYHPGVPAGGDERAAAESLMCAYLDRFGSWAVGLQGRLTGYRIGSIAVSGAEAEPMLEGKKGFVFEVMYDVRMPVLNDWVAGNGDVSPGNWMLGKYSYVIVEEKNGQYVMAGIGSGK